MNHPGTILGVDIGGTTTRVGVVAEDGCLMAMRCERTPAEGEPRALARMLRAMQEVVSDEQPVTHAVAGVALPGIRDARTQVMHRAVHLPRLEGQNIAALFSEALGRPVRLDADVLAAGFAQWHAEADRPPRFLYLSIGTGVGGCAVVDGRVVRHTNNGSGHFGFVVVDTDPDAARDRAGLSGTLEAVVSGDAFAAAGDAAREQILPARLAIGLHQLSAIYLPDVIAIGGGIANANPRLVELAAQEFARRPYPLRAVRPRISLARLKSDEAGAIGAALLAVSEP
jgi:predicted NBD/HSP70 family sugar kinase